MNRIESNRIKLNSMELIQIESNQIKLNQIILKQTEWINPIQFWTWWIKLNKLYGMSSD